MVDGFADLPSSGRAAPLHGAGCGGIDTNERQVRPVFKPATANDLELYYGKRPEQTVKALIAWLCDVPVGVIGISYNGKSIVLFSEFRPVMRPYLRSMPVLRAIKKVQDFMRETGAPIIAIADPNEPESANILTRLGFEHCVTTEQGEMYQWHN